MPWGYLSGWGGAVYGIGKIMYNYIQTASLVLNRDFFIPLLVFERSLFKTSRYHGKNPLIEKLAVLY